MNTDLIIMGIIGFIVIVLIILIIRLYFMVNGLSVSISKLGYVIREDAKKYFDEAADKLIETNEQFSELYTKIVKDGTESALTEVGSSMERNLEKSHREAGLIILEAREDAQQIIKAAQTDTEVHTARMIEQSSATIQWVLEQYVKETFSVDQHTEIINKLLDEYINENRL